MKKIIVDVDYTIAKKNSSYENAIPHKEMIEKIVEYKEKGFKIIFYSARNMRTFNGDIDKIMQFSYPVMIEWLEKHKVPYDEVILGKPWNDEGFYIDDNAVRPKEFLAKDYDELIKTLDKERKELWK